MSKLIDKVKDAVSKARPKVERTLLKGASAALHTVEKVQAKLPAAKAAAAKRALEKLGETQAGTVAKRAASKVATTPAAAAAKRVASRVAQAAENVDVPLEGKKTRPAAAAKRATKPAPKKEGFKVKRGQKHHHHH